MSEVVDVTSLALPALPVNWRYRTVREIGASGEQPVLTGPFGTNLGRGDFIESGVPLLTIGCLTESGINLDKALFVSEAKAEELSRYRLKAGDLLFSRMASVGRAGLVPKWLEGALFNYHIMRLRLDESRIDTRLFINYVRGAPQVRDYLKAVNHGATRDGINTEQLLELPVAVPPIDEQREIVAELEKQFSRLDEAVANLKRVKANLKRYKASVLKDAVEGRLVPTEAELARREGRSFETGEQLLQRILDARRSQWTGRGKYKEPAGSDTTHFPALPEGWGAATTGELCDCIVPSRDKPKSFSGSTPWLTLPDFCDDEIVISHSRVGLGLSKDEIAESKAKVVPKDSVVMSCVGRFGITAVLGEDAVINQQLHAFLPNALVVPQYLAYALRTRVKEMTAVSTATTIAYLNKENCNSVRLALPPLPEQIRIVAEVDRRLSLVLGVEAEVEANVKRAAGLRQSILRTSFEGRSARLVVPANAEYLAIA